ncbi:hypothetical protein D3C86_1240660 [compost metagenome]
MVLARLVRVVKHVQVAMRASVHQGWIADDRLAAPLDLHDFGQGAERPRRQVFVRQRLGHLRIAGGQLLERGLRLLAEFRAQLRQIAPGRQHAAVLVDHAEVHEQVRGQRFKLEVAHGRAHLHLVPHVGNDRVNQALLRIGLPFKPAVVETGRVVGQRHAMAAQLLRQRLQQQVDLFLQHAGH